LDRPAARRGVSGRTARAKGIHQQQHVRSDLVPGCGRRRGRNNLFVTPLGRWRSPCRHREAGWLLPPQRFIFTSVARWSPAAIRRGLGGPRHSGRPIRREPSEVGISGDLDPRARANGTLLLPANSRGPQPGGNNMFYPGPGLRRSDREHSGSRAVSNTATGIWFHILADLGRSGRRHEPPIAPSTGERAMTQIADNVGAQVWVAWVFVEAGVQISAL
jgi:hypothetical protein